MAEEKKATKKKLTFRERLALATYEINKQDLKQSGSNPFFGNSKYSTLHDFREIWFVPNFQILCEWRQ